MIIYHVKHHVDVGLDSIDQLIGKKRGSKTGYFKVWIPGLRTSQSSDPPTPARKLQGFPTIQVGRLKVWHPQTHETYNETHFSLKYGRFGKIPQIREQEEHVDAVCSSFILA